MKEVYPKIGASPTKRWTNNKPSGWQDLMVKPQRNNVATFKLITIVKEHVIHYEGKELNCYKHDYLILT